MLNSFEAKDGGSQKESLAKTSKLNHGRKGLASNCRDLFAASRLF